MPAAFLTAPWNFPGDLETALVNVLQSGELEIPMPGAQVLDYFEEENIRFEVKPETTPGLRETKGRLPIAYVWNDGIKGRRRGNKLYEVSATMRVLFYASLSTSLEEGHKKAMSFATAVASLCDQLSLKVYDDYPINPTPLLDDWRGYANGMPATMTAQQVDVKEEDQAGIVGRARLTLELVHNC